MIHACEPSAKDADEVLHPLALRNACAALNILLSLSAIAHCVLSIESPPPPPPSSGLADSFKYWIVRLGLQLTTLLARALVRGVLWAVTILEIFSRERLKPFQRLPFYKHLEHLFLRTLAKAEAETTPTTVQRLIMTQPGLTRIASQVGCFGHVAGK